MEKDLCHMVKGNMVEEKEGLEKGNMEERDTHRITKEVSSEVEKGDMEKDLERKGLEAAQYFTDRVMSVDW